MTLEAQRETILQLGAGTWMKWTIRRLRGLGYRVFAADRNPDAPAFAEADGHAPVDIIDAAAIEAYARDIRADLVMVVNGAGVISGAHASERLGLPALPVDVAIRTGSLQQVFPVGFPHIPNYDVAGVVTEVGEGVSGWSAGDAVIAFLPIAAPGAAAEYVAAPAEALALAPRTVELADAAALPSVGLAAWQAVFEHAGLKSGQSVLVNGAGGAVGGSSRRSRGAAGRRRAAAAAARVRSPRSPRQRECRRRRRCDRPNSALPGRAPSRGDSVFSHTSDRR